MKEEKDAGKEDSEDPSVAGRATQHVDERI